MIENEEQEMPLLQPDYQVTGEQVQHFRNNGHIITPNLLSADELKDYRPAILKAAEKQNTEKRKLMDRDTYGKAFLQIMNLWQSDIAVRKFVLAKRFAKVAADLLGVKNVRIYHDQALLKEPGGGPTPWHQDQYYWPLDTSNTVTMWMPLVDIPNHEMGMLTFASGSHKNGYVFDHEISDESETKFENYVRKKGFNISRPDHLNAGDATWHYGYTIHNAPGNSSDILREVMTIIYYADEARITEPQNKWQENDRQKWLMSLPVGSYADSELNPVVL